MPQGEFIALMALMMSLVALSIDTILPALPNIAADFNVAAGNNIQQVIAVLFLGLTIGQLFYGPLSDQIGRKPTILIGASVYIIGSLMGAMAESFTVLLISRFLQGFGVAGYRRLQPPRGSVHCAQDIRDQRFIGILLSQSVSLIQSLLKPAPAVEHNQTIDLLLGRRIIASGLFLVRLCHLIDF